MADTYDLDPAVRIEEILNGDDIEPANRLEYFLKKAATEVPKPTSADAGKVITVNEDGDGYELGEGGGGTSGIGYYNTSELLTSPVTVPDLTTGGVIAFNDPHAVALVSGVEQEIYVTDRPLPLIYEDSNSGNIALPNYINQPVEPNIIHFDNPTTTPMFYIRSITDNAKNFVLSHGEDLYIFYNISDVDIVYGYTGQ